MTPPQTDTALASPPTVSEGALGRIVAWIPRDSILGLILVAAFLLRAYVATTSSYLPDERELAIPLAESISFSPASLNLPIRGVDHPALPSYFIKVSAGMFGHSPLGYRFLHVLSGLLAILVVFRIADEWSGRSAARWAAALVAFNEYHIGVSAFATAKGPHLLFIVLAIFAFSRFLQGEKAGYLYLAAAMTGLGFYCKEHSALLLPVFLVSLFQARYRRWFRGRHVYLAGLVFIAVIGPDILWNLGANQNGAQATYRDHLSRIGGLGVTTNYFMFFARGAIQALYALFTGDDMPDSVSENPSMNSVLGLVLVGAVLLFTFRRNHDAVGLFLLTLFWWVLGFFVFIRPGEPLRAMDKAAWYWIDATMFPAAIVAGCLLAGAQGPWRIGARAIASGAILYSCLHPWASR